MPCQQCDTCEGKRHDSDDICRHASYAKYHGIKEIDYKVAMKEWGEWQEELRERRKRLETKPKRLEKIVKNKGIFLSIREYPDFYIKIAQYLSR